MNPQSLGKHPTTPPPTGTFTPPSTLASNQIHIISRVLHDFGRRSQGNRHIFGVSTIGDSLAFLDHLGVLKELVLKIVVDVAFDYDVFGVMLQGLGLVGGNSRYWPSIFSGGNDIEI